jgi:hypothetical protein
MVSCECPFCEKEFQIDEKDWDEIYWGHKGEGVSE